jgi:hypothetical protein
MVDIRNALRFSATLGALMLALTPFGQTPARAATAQVPAPTPAPPLVPVDVRIPVELTTPLTSQTAHVGDPFGFKTTKDEKLGMLEVPAGTPGTGRLASVQPAHDKQNGSLSLQVDSLELATGTLVWVNIDPSRPPTGHYSDKHTHYYLLPLPIGVVPGIYNSVSGNMVIDAGTGFRVVTIAPRTAPAPLVTASPSPSGTPSAPATPPAAPAPSPAAT